MQYTINQKLSKITNNTVPCRLSHNKITLRIVCIMFGGAANPHFDSWKAEDTQNLTQ